MRDVPEEAICDLEAHLGGFVRRGEVAGEKPIQGAVLPYFELEGGGVSEAAPEDGTAVGDGVKEVFMRALVVGGCEGVVGC